MTPPPNWPSGACCTATTSASPGSAARLQNRLTLELTDSQAGGILDCPTCTLTALTDAINAPNQALGFASVPVPGPMAGAGLPGLLAACLGIWGLNRRRRNATNATA